jgi:hypothetical protein
MESLVDEALVAAVVGGWVVLLGLGFAGDFVVAFGFAAAGLVALGDVLAGADAVVGSGNG